METSLRWGQVNLLHFESKHALFIFCECLPFPLGHLLTCITRGNNFPNQPGFLMSLYVLENMLSQVLLHNQHCSDPTIKRLSHLLHREVPLSVKPAKDFWNLPAESIWKWLKCVYGQHKCLLHVFYYIQWQWCIARTDRYEFLLF